MCRAAGGELEQIQLLLGPGRTSSPGSTRTGGELEQIQLLLGHASVQTTERYLGTRQDLITPQAANKRIRVHGIPRHDGRIDPEEAARIFHATLDIRQQERGTAAKRIEPTASDRTGGANRRTVSMGALSAAGRRPEIQTAIDAVKLQERQLELKRKQGELVDLSLVEAEWTRIAIQFRSAVLGLPGRIVNRIPAEYRREVVAAAEDEARQVLIALSNEIRSGQEAS